MDSKQKKKMEGFYTLQFNNDPIKAQHFIECIEHLYNHIINEADADNKIDDLYRQYDDLTRDERRKLIKKQKSQKRKQNKKKEKVFKSETLVKPSKVQIFRNMYRKECEEQKIEYVDAEFRIKYNTRNKETDDLINAECEKLTKEYYVKLEAERQQAIKEGRFHESEPDKARKPYNFFVQDYYKLHFDASKYENETKDMNPKEKQNFIMKKSGKHRSEIWNKVKESTDQFSKYKTLAKYDEDLYNHLMYERKIRYLKIQIEKCKRENTTFNNHEDELNILVSNPMPKPENLSDELMKYFNKSESKSDNNKSNNKKTNNADTKTSNDSSSNNASNNTSENKAKSKSKSKSKGKSKGKTPKKQKTEVANLSE